MNQKTYISNLCENNPETVIFGSLGTISEDLSQIKRKNTYLTKGAMGCVMGMALGYALHSKKKVICLIGDGSFLMKMGSMSTILAHKPKNLEVIIINNNSYRSCGGQGTNFKFLPKLPKPFKVYDISTSNN